MKKIFWGFFFIFLDFSLNFNQYSLNILPDFVGYLLLFQGTRALAEESCNFKSVQPFTVGMAVYTAILWLGALLGINSGAYGQTLTWMLDLVSLVVSLYIAWVLVQGVLEIEERRTADLNGGTLYKWWKALVAIQAVARLLGLMADFANVTVLVTLAAVLVIAAIVVIVLYLIAWWKTAKTWEALPGQEGGASDNL